MFFPIYLAVLGTLLLPQTAVREELVKIPLRFTEESIPLVSVTIKGENFSAWVDTGRGKAFVRADVLQPQDYVETGKVYKTQGFNQPVKEDKEIRIDSLIVGSKEFQNVLAFLGNGTSPYYIVSKGKTEQKSLSTPPLILGNEIFRGGVLLIDYPNLVLKWGDSIREFMKEITYMRWSLVTFQIDGGEIQFYGATKGQKGRWVLDTGSSINLMFTGKNPLNPLVLSKTEDLTMTLGRGTFNVKDVYLTNKSLQPNLIGILGAPFFQEHRVLIDFLHHQLYIESPTPRNKN